MSTTYIQKRIIGVLVLNLLDAGYLIDVNDNDGDRETHLGESRDYDAIMAAIFNPTLDCVDYCLDLRRADRQHPDRSTEAYVRLIDGNGATVISDYTTNLETVIAPANALADEIDANETAWFEDELEARNAMLAALQSLADHQNDYLFSDDQEMIAAAIAKATGET